MSTAEELLNSLSEDDIATYSADTTAEPHMVIGEDRRIIVPEQLKLLGVQYDHDMETVVIDCPRYWDEHDMSTMAVYINYRRSDGYTDSYPVTKNNILSDIMELSWTISRNVTEVKGNLSFLVCVKNVDAEGVESNHWNSELCQDCYISEGMETSENPVEMYPDEITQLLLRMDVVEGYRDEMQRMVSTAEDYAYMSQNASDQSMSMSEQAQSAADEAKNTLTEVEAAAAEIRNSYANAIKGTVSGEIVRVEDVSPLEHDLEITVHGRNLFDSSDYTTEKDYSTGESVFGFSTKHLVIGREYTVFSEVPMRWFKISSSLTGYSCCGLSNTVNGFTSYTFVHTRNPNIPDSEPLKIYVDNLEHTADTDLTVLNTMKICIVEGPVPTKYEPYINPTGHTVSVCGKNLAPTTEFSITGTVMKYGAIGDFSGSLLVKNIPIKPGVTYAVSAIIPTQIPCLTAFLYNGLLSDSVKHHNGCYSTLYTTGRGTQVQLTEGKVTNTSGYEYMAITIGNVSTYTEGETKTITVKKLQVEVGDTATAFEPYRKIESAQNAIGDGFMADNIKSISPIITAFVDSPGLILEMTYNRDTTKMFESYVLTDEAISEITARIKAENDKEIDAIEGCLDEIIAIQESLI